MKREILHIAELLQCGMKCDIEFVASALCRGRRTGEFLACWIVQFQVKDARNTSLPAFHVHVGARNTVPSLSRKKTTPLTSNPSNIMPNSLFHFSVGSFLSLKSRMTGFRSSF